MTILWIIIGLCIILAIGPIAILLEKPYHWLLRKRGVTELTWKQRRGVAKRYKESTGRRFVKRKR